jgi:RimJ/RimL family protein N-acetyltransferase
VAEGERIYLRPVALADAGARYVAWMNDPEINRYLESRFEAATLPGLRSFIRSMRADPDNVFLAIVLKRGHRHIGNIKLGPINRIHGFGEIGILLGEKDCWGKGYATEAISVLSDYAFGRLGLHKLTAGAYAANRGSVRAFLKAGFAREGVKRDQYRCGNGYQDLVLLGKVAPSGSKQGGKRG